MKIFGIVIMKKLDYIKMERSLYGLARDYDNLCKDYEAIRKKLIYQQTYNDTFKQKLNEVIFPNTDERGLGEQEIPVNFPDLW